MSEDNGQFYRDKAWELLMKEIGDLKINQEAIAKDVSEIKNKISWIIGIATGVTLVINVAWEYAKSKFNSFIKS